MKSVCLYCFEAQDDYYGHQRVCPKRNVDMIGYTADGSISSFTPAPVRGDKNTPDCRYCGQPVTRDGDMWLDEFLDRYCGIHIEGCRACDDGESHPHAPWEAEQ